MQKVDLAELRRLHAQGARSSHSFYVFDSIPAMLDELESAREEVRRLTQANGDLRKERDRSVAEAQRQDGVAKGLRKERDQLSAHVERLRAAIGCFLTDAKRAIPMAGGTWSDWYCGLCGVVGAHDDECSYPIAADALAATPAQSLAANTAGQEMEDAFEFTKGHEYTDDLPVAGIHVRGANGWHGNKIEVYGDCAVSLRDRILALLTTPAQSLAAHDAALLRRLAAKLDGEGHPANEYYRNWLMAEADRIEKEADHA